MKLLKLGLIGVLSFCSLNATAAVDDETIVRYYASPAKVKLVGFVLNTCGSMVIKEGKVTPYSSVQKMRECKISYGPKETKPEPRPKFVERN